MVPKLVAQILARRGMAPEAMAAFLWPNYDEHLHDPYLMTDMDRAVERLVAAVENGERVVVYGDYDIDGITASAVLLESLRALGADVHSYIPDRFEEGYGLNTAALEALQAEGATLVVSVDCGITSVAEADWAREHGLDLVITDHHTPPEVLPEAVAVVNPKRPGDDYPFKELCGAGVAFKLVQALQRRTGIPEAGQEKWLLDLVALGTVCDVVDLVGENRVLVAYGLKVMQRTRRPGLRALAVVGGVDIRKITARELGFVLGPRMNAAGRLDHAARSLELVETADEARAMVIANELENLNRQRRADQDRIFKEAMVQAEAHEADSVLVLADGGWSHGIVGIVASKLAERWGRPVVLGQVMGETTKASARSVAGFNMVQALRSCAELLTKYGGHYYAAGMTLPTANLEALRERLGRLAGDGGADESEATEADVVLDDLAEIGWPVYDDLALLEPYGAAHPVPVFELRQMVLGGLSQMGADGSHLRLAIQDEAGRTLAGVGFGLAGRYGQLQPGQRITVRGSLNKNEFRGERTLQLVVTDIHHE